MNGTLTLIERKLLQRTLQDAGDAACVVLVGSVARGARSSPMGDLDVLIIDGSSKKSLHPGIQTTVLTRDALRERVLRGDDFAQWALRFGISLRGRSNWKELQRDLLHQAPWPNPEMKREHAVRRLERAKELLEMGDVDAAQEELLYASTHLARAKLLRLGIFPLSRPELTRQLAPAGEAELARLLERLQLEHNLNAGEVKRYIGRIEELVAEKV